MQRVTVSTCRAAARFAGNDSRPNFTIRVSSHCEGNMTVTNGGSRSTRLMCAFISIALLFACGGCTSPNPNVTTGHNDNLRTGAYLAETTLSPQAVARQGMHIKYWIASGDAPLEIGPGVWPVGEKKDRIDGGVDVQPLYLRHVQFPRETANGLYVGTTGAKFYAFNADNGTSEWVRDLTEGDSGECRQARGLDTTPVIDVERHRIFVLFSTQVGSGKSNAENCGPNLFGNYIEYFLASLDLSDGSGFFKKIEAHDDLSGLAFNAQTLNSHPALLLDHNSIFIGFGSAQEGNNVPFKGWVMRYKADDLRLLNTFCTSATATGAGVWQGGGGLAADEAGNAYFLTGNGPTDFQDRLLVGGGVTNNRQYGDSFMKLGLSAGKFVPTAFAPEDGCGPLCAGDADLGSGGPLVIPNSNRVIGGGKTGVMYLLDSASMARVQEFEASTNQYHPNWRAQGWDVGPHLHGSPTYWRGPDARYGNLYVWGEKDYLKLYRYDTRNQEFETKSVSVLRSGGLLEVIPHAQGNILALPNTMPGGMLSVSANGNQSGSGIVWATLPLAPCLPSLDPCWKKERPPFPGALYAFDAESLKLLWNDATLSMVEGSKWVPPTIADGKVFVTSTVGMIVVYELCQQGNACVGGTIPIQPEVPAPQPCQGCHSSPFQKPSLVYIPLSKRFPSESAVSVYFKSAIRKVTPKQDVAQDLLLNGQGFLVYGAEQDSKEGGRLKWELRDNTAELEEVRVPGAKEGKDALLMRIRLEAGTKWVASDGSVGVTEMEKTIPAPETSDAAWLLLRVVKSNGKGLMSHHRYIARTYTDGGAPPNAPPKRRDETFRVAYRAQYRMYR